MHHLFDYLTRRSGLAGIPEPQLNALVSALAEGRPVDLSQHWALARARDLLAAILTADDLADLRRLSAESGAVAIALLGLLHQPWWTDADDVLPVLLLHAPGALGQLHADDLDAA